MPEGDDGEAGDGSEAGNEVEKAGHARGTALPFAFPAKLDVPWIANSA